MCANRFRASCVALDCPQTSPRSLVLTSSSQRRSIDAHLGLASILCAAAFGHKKSTSAECVKGKGILESKKS